jgi:aspartyl-tRNA synthetase
MPLELIDVDDLMGEVDFKVFAGPADDPGGPRGGAARARRRRRSRARRSTTTPSSSASTAPGPGLDQGQRSGRAGPRGLQSPILKFMPEDSAVQRHHGAPEAADGDMIFFGADRAPWSTNPSGALRLKVATTAGWSGGWAPLWVVDFPMFEDDGTGGWTPLHHPFTAPACDARYAAPHPGEALSRAYDMVLNGTELGGGSIRIRDRETCRKRCSTFSASRRRGPGEVRLPARRAALRLPRRTVAWPSAWTGWSC